ncbi:MAG: GNAT family N-acetyltransferase [Bacillaceae bacterium]|nr:GNAT family N-acetyltransferase [Bacillaceae bacterium]
MIRKLTNRDHQSVIKFLVEKAALNTFIIGDIENYGYDQDFQEVWGEVDEQGNVTAVLLRYYHAYMFYADGDFDPAPFADIIKQDPDFEVLQGPKEIVSRFRDFISIGDVKETYFAELDDGRLLPEEIPDGIRVEKATIDDVDEILALRRQIKEFTIGPNAREMMIRKFKTGAGKIYIIRKEGKMIATASTTAENSYTAMIVGVATLPEYRNRGYATACMAQLCRDLLAEGKKSCLFYDNPAAGSIYRRIGFRETGLWHIYYGPVSES